MEARAVEGVVKLTACTACPEAVCPRRADSHLPPEEIQTSLDAIAIFLENEKQYVCCGHVNHPIINE